MDRRSFFVALAGLPFLRWLKPKYTARCNIVSNRVKMTTLYYGPGPFDIKPQFIRTTDGMMWERRHGIPSAGTVIYIPE